MSEAKRSGSGFVGYEYRDITVPRDKEAIYVDGYENFGWTLESRSALTIGLGSVILKFKRDRKIRNKAELTRLQRQFDAYVNEINRMEASKVSSASIAAFTVGIIGTAFMAGSVFAVVGGMVVLCIILAIPAFAGWIVPYFLYNSTYAKKTAKVEPLIDSKYDEIYEICERGNSLLGNTD
jgi:hypothetical protein